MSTSTGPFNKTIKVLQLGSPTGLYGAERWILALVRHLDPNKITSIVGVIKDDPDQSAPLCKQAEILGFQTQCFEGQGRINYSVIRKIRHFIVQNNIDILHTHFYKTDIIGFFATRGTPCKIISTPHGWSKKMDFKLWCYETLDRLFFPFFDAVVPLSEDLFSPLSNLPFLKKKLHLIRNGVDLSEIIQSVHVNSDLLKMKDKGKFILGYIGQLIPRKGLNTLFHALKNLKNIDWELFLVGEGPQRNELEDLAGNLQLAGKIHFVGFRQDRLEFLKGFDIFILPSLLEGIPRCLMESMAAKIPVVASDIPGCRDLIINNHTGQLFPVDSPEQLAETILHTYHGGTKIKNMVSNAYDFVMQNFSAERMAKEYEALFLKLASTE